MDENIDLKPVNACYSKFSNSSNGFVACKEIYPSRGLPAKSNGSLQKQSDQDLNEHPLQHLHSINCNCSLKNIKRDRHISISSVESTKRNTSFTARRISRSRNCSGKSLASVASTVKDIDGYTYTLFEKNLTLFFMLLVNLLNYVDRYTIAGVLDSIQREFKISNSKAGLLQTSFIMSYMILSPIFGYLGDRFNRKLIMGWGILFWSFVTLAGSFVSTDKFWLFLLLRGLVGVGEASYSTIAPTIIADLFKGQQRTIALAIFFFAIPVGSGMGYIVGANVASAFQSWRYAFRVTPGLGVLCVIAIVFIVREPARGASEGGTHIVKTSYYSDLVYLAKNKSFIFSSLGFTCVAFVAGALSLWIPVYLQYSARVQGGFASEKNVALKFGVITCIAGFIGVGCGTAFAAFWRKKNPRADPLVCAIGMISAAPFIYMAFLMSRTNMMATWAFIFIGETMVCLNWAIVADIVLYTVIPTRRSTAEAIQILLSHALGDAGSPYFVGVLSDYIMPKFQDRGEVPAQFLSLRYALYSTCFVCVIGGGFFLATALFVNKDRAKCDKVIKGALNLQDEIAGMLPPETNTNDIIHSPENGLVA